MRFLTPSKCDEWIESAPAIVSEHHLSLQLPTESGRLLFIARNVVDAITFRQPCLLYVTDWEIWPSSNNWLLYYRLRQSYGDRLLIDEAPGHLFLDHEVEDLAAFLHVAMLFGWDADLRPRAPYISGKLSHEGFLELSSADPHQLSGLTQILRDAKLAVEPRS